jgi:dihydroxycyclohexadiene carboxylate dehydrogenase
MVLRFAGLQNNHRRLEVHAMTTTLDSRASGARRLQDKVSIVTGAGQGIGAATARRFGEEGATVVLADRAEEGVTRLSADLDAHGVPNMVFLGDLSDWDTCHRLMEQTIDRFGRIDVLVNNVGGTIRSQEFWHFTQDQIEQEMQRSFWPTIFCMRAVLPHMVDRRGGAIVNLGSTAVHGILRGPYAAAKGGVIALTTSVALETATLGVRINCVAPHATTISDRLVPRNPDRAPRSPEEEQAGRDTMARFLGEGPYAGIEPEEQAAAIAFLASEDASFMTGQVLWVGS